MDQVSSLAAFLEGSQDVAACILSLVPLRTLASLACSSRGLRAVVSRQPEIVWRVRAPAGAEQYFTFSLPVTGCRMLLAAPTQCYLRQAS